MSENIWDWIWRTGFAAAALFFVYFAWLSSGTPLVIVCVFGAIVFGVTVLSYPRPLP